jgi:hypothetical protein
MKEFVARQTHGGTYKWHGSFVSGEEAREHGIRFGIHISSLVREAAVRQVAADLADLGEDWLHPMGSPDGLWLIHLDKVVTVFPSLTEQQWLKGDRSIEPEFDIIESSIGGRVQRTGVVRWTVLPESRALHLSIPPAPELEHCLAAFRRDHEDSRRCGFLMMPFAETPGHTTIARIIRQTCEIHGVEALRVDDHRYSDEVLPNIRTCMHGCGFGIAVFERLTADHFNPNVSLEVGYMLALGKPVCLLKDSTLQALPTDLVGRLYESFDVQRVDETIPKVLHRWLHEKGLALDGG